jgi:hypothetical protein
VQRPRLIAVALQQAGRVVAALTGYLWCW